MKVAHIYASNAKINSGDYMLGLATKWYFKTQMQKNDNITFVDFDCRKGQLFNNSNINKLNKYDYILVGGGGLILPDSSPNKISGWQWNISTSNMKKIIRPIYVISIGCNLFFNQEITMQDRNSNKKTDAILPIFRENITQLINQSAYFSMRHHGDITKFIAIIGNEYIDKVVFQQCPCVDYVEMIWRPKMDASKKKYIAIEIKDDREWRRYYKIGKEAYYNKLLEFVKKCLNEKKDICYLSHDGSKKFYNYLRSKQIQLPLLDCSTGNETDILNKYSKIHTILCSAGHSQMFSYALGINVVSLITHPKLGYFCEDFNLLENAIYVNDDIDKLFRLTL